MSSSAKSLSIVKRFLSREKVNSYTLCNSSSGLSIEVVEYGAMVMSIKTPDKNGVVEEITLQYPTLKEVLDEKKIKGSFPYFGCVVGRVANRIARGTFELDKVVYKNLFANNPPNTLHGGKVGFDQKVYESKEVRFENAVGVEFSYISPDGEENYPGTVHVTIQYLLTADNKMVISYSGEAVDKPTIMNLTNHSYFNLSGNFKQSMLLDHTLQLSCNHYLPMDETEIPTGHLQPVTQSAFDFTTTKSLGKACELTGGFDHCFLINGAVSAYDPSVYLYNPVEQLQIARDAEKTGTSGSTEGSFLRHAATLNDLRSGRVMTVHCTQPGMQVYTANFLDGAPPFVKHNAVCLETQHYPDAANQPSFPSVVIRPGTTLPGTPQYFHQAVYGFSTNV